MSVLWAKIDNADNAFLGLFTDAEKNDDDKTNTVPDGHFWERYDCDCGDNKDAEDEAVRLRDELKDLRQMILTSPKAAYEETVRNFARDISEHGPNKGMLECAANSEIMGTVVARINYYRELYKNEHSRCFHEIHEMLKRVVFDPSMWFKGGV